MREMAGILVAGFPAGLAQILCHLKTVFQNCRRGLEAFIRTIYYLLLT